MYSGPVSRIVREHGMQHHGYADDTQAYNIIRTQAKWQDMELKIQKCMKDISCWMQQNSLKLNDDKFEYIIFRPKRLHSLRDSATLTLSGITIKPASQVRNLGVVQDECLCMESHVNSIIKSCFFQIHAIGRIRQYITVAACKSLVQSLIVSRLDYANALLHGLPMSLTVRLQRVQNSAARWISRTSAQDHITPVLISLHWLPVDCRSKFKILVLTYEALHGLAPLGWHLKMKF